MAAQQPSREEQQKAFVEQLKMRGAYAERCGEGYKPFEKYLESLKSDLDDILNIPLKAEEAEKVRGAHSDFKSRLESARRQIAKYTDLDRLVKKVLSGSIASEEEAKQLVAGIQESYESVIGGVIGMYQFLNPELEIPINGVPVKSLYYQLAEIKKVDIKSRFEEGFEIIKTYYINEDVEKIISQQQKKAREQEALPQAA